MSILTRGNIVLLCVSVPTGTHSAMQYLHVIPNPDCACKTAPIFFIFAALKPARRALQYTYRKLIRVVARWLRARLWFQAIWFHAVRVHGGGFSGPREPIGLGTEVVSRVKPRRYMLSVFKLRVARLMNRSNSNTDVIYNYVLTKCVCDIIMIKL